MRTAALWPAVAATSALAATGAVGFGVTTPLRGVLVIWFVIVCPGMAVVALLRIRDPLFVLVATIAISLALGVVVATSLLYLDLWSPRRALVILGGLTLALSLVSSGRPDAATARDWG
jgi:hypothetical protein